MQTRSDNTQKKQLMNRVKIPFKAAWLDHGAQEAFKLAFLKRHLVSHRTALDSDE